MFESKINRGRANGYAPLDSGSKVPLSYLPPIQSTIDTGSFVTNTQTGSFATTGSNIFIGEQTISTIQGTGSLYLKPDVSDNRHFEIYNTSPSDTHIKANGGLSFFGDDTNYLKIDDGNSEITLRASSTIILETGNGDIILNPDSGLYKGSAGIGNALVTEGNLDSVISSFVTNTSFNEYTASVTMSANIDTSSFATTGSNDFIGNQTINGSLTISTPSAGVPNSVSNWDGQGGWNQGSYTNLTTTGGTGEGLTVDVAAGGGGYINIEAISINTPGSGYSNGDIITIDNENNLPGTFTISIEEGSGWVFNTSGSLTTPGDINVNGSATIDGGYLILTGSVAPTDLSGSIGDTEGMVIFDDNYLYYCTADFVPETYQIIVSNGLSYDTHVTIAKNQPGASNLSSNGWSITTSGDVTYVLTGVYSDGDNWDCEIDNLNSNYNGGTQTMTLTDLNYTSVDIWKRVSLNPLSSNIISSSAQITALGFTSASNDQNLSTTSSVQFHDLAIDGTGSFQSDVTIYGNLQVWGTQSVINSTNVELSDNILYLAPTGGGDFDLGIVGHYNDGTYSHAGIFSDASDGHAWKVFKGLTTETTGAYVDTNGVGYTLADFKANNIYGGIYATNGVISGSSQVLGGSGIYSSSAQLPSGLISGSSQLTASYDTRYTLSGSVVSGTTPAGTISGSSQLTSSFDGRYTQTGSFNTLTASFNSFTASAQSVTTGSNSFNGTQTITGSLIITTGSFVASQILANTASLYLTSGSNLYVQNNGVVEITGSLIATSIMGSIASTNGLISSSAQITSFGFVSASTSLPDGTISGSAQITAFGFISSSTSAPAGTISGSSQITGIVNLTNLSATSQISASVFVGGFGVAEAKYTVISAKPMTFYPNPSIESVRFTTAGAVLIGGNHSENGFKLSVTGSARIIGTAVVTGSLVVSDGITGTMLATNGVISGSSQLTSSYDTRYVLSGSVSEVPAGTISGSAQITSFGFVSGSYEMVGRGIISSSADLVTTASFNSYTASISTASLVTSISNLNSATSSYLTSLSGAISSSSQLTSSFDVRYTLSGSGVTINTSSFATTGSNTFTGLQTFQQIQEVVSLKPSLGLGTNNFDFNSGSIFYIAGLTGSGTWNVQNIPSASNSATSLTFVIQQGVTAYSASAYQLGGTAVTVKWLDTIIPTGSASSTDVIGLTAFRSGSSWNVIGSLSKFA